MNCRVPVGSGGSSSRRYTTVMTRALYVVVATGQTEVDDDWRMEPARLTKVQGTVRTSSRSISLLYLSCTNRSAGRLRDAFVEPN
jgi:hypothetical protein